MPQVWPVFSCFVFFWPLLLFPSSVFFRTPVSFLVILFVAVTQTTKLKLFLCNLILLHMSYLFHALWTLWRLKSMMKISCSFRTLLGNWLTVQTIIYITKTAWASTWDYHIYQPLRSGRIWHKVNFYAEFNRFEFRVLNSIHALVPK